MLGWIKLHRRLAESSIYHDSRLVHLWIHLLMKANHKPNKFLFNGEEITVKNGQLITGRKTLSAELKMPESKIQTGLKLFEKLHMIEQQTNSRNRLVSVVSWHTYQEGEQQTNNKRTANEQQTNTNKNEKNEKNEINNKDEFFEDLIIGALNRRGFLDIWKEFVVFRKEEKKVPLTERSAKMTLKKLSSFGLEGAIASLENSISAGYKGVFEPSGGSMPKKNYQQTNVDHLRELSKVDPMDLLEQNNQQAIGCQ